MGIKSVKYEYNSWIYEYVQKTSYLGGSITEDTYCCMGSTKIYVLLAVVAYNTQFFTAIPHVLGGC